MEHIENIEPSDSLKKLLQLSSCCHGALVNGGLQCEICGAGDLLFPDSWGTRAACPVCKSVFVHFSGDGKYRDSDDYSAWEGRGAAFRIPFYCEGGHSWYIRFGFHKGNTYQAIERVYDQDFSGNEI